jgi:hypothetical protein
MTALHDAWQSPTKADPVQYLEGPADKTPSVKVSGSPNGAYQGYQQWQETPAALEKAAAREAQDRQLHYMQQSKLQEDRQSMRDNKLLMNLDNMITKSNETRTYQLQGVADNVRVACEPLSSKSDTRGLYVVVVIGFVLVLTGLILLAVYGKRAIVALQLQRLHVEQIVELIENQ